MQIEVGITLGNEGRPNLRFIHGAVKAGVLIIFSDTCYHHALYLLTWLDPHPTRKTMEDSSHIPC